MSSRPAWVTEQNLATCPETEVGRKDGEEQERRKQDVVVYGSLSALGRLRQEDFYALTAILSCIASSK